MSDDFAKEFFAGLLPDELRTKEAKRFEKVYKLATALRLALAKVAIPNPYRRFRYPYHEEHDEMLADLAAFAFDELQGALKNDAVRAGVEAREPLPTAPDITRYKQRKHEVLLAEEQSMRMGYRDGYLYGFNDFYDCLDAGMDIHDTFEQLEMFHAEACGWEENPHKQLDLIEAELKVSLGVSRYPNYAERYLKCGRRIPPRGTE